MGFVAPILATLMMGIADLTMGFGAKFSLEQAAQRTLERTRIADSGSDYSYLRAEAAAAANVPESQVTVDAWLECDGTRQAAFTGTCTEAQSIARYVQITIVSYYDTIFPYGVLAQKFASQYSNGNLRISADASVRVQ
jgi:hypothetical protein